MTKAPISPAASAAHSSWAEGKYVREPSPTKRSAACAANVPGPPSVAMRSLSEGAIRWADILRLRGRDRRRLRRAALARLSRDGREGRAELPAGAALSGSGQGARRDQARPGGGVRLRSPEYLLPEPAAHAVHRRDGSDGGAKRRHARRAALRRAGGRGARRAHVQVRPGQRLRPG